MPALLIRMLGVPNSFIACGITWDKSALLETSALRHRIHCPGETFQQLDTPTGIFKFRAVSRDDSKVGTITEEFSRKIETDAA